MNCDEFLEALEGSEERQRGAARSHARSCTTCAALAEVHERLKTKLRTHDPLPRHLREAWAAAADEPSLGDKVRRDGRSTGTSLTPSSSAAMGLVSLAAALLLLVTVGLLIGNRSREIVRPIPPPAPVSLAKTIDASEELDDLLAQVKSLEAKLLTITPQAELVDARREANDLLATYSQW